MVEDAPKPLGILMRELRACGYAVDGVGTGSDALVRAAEHHYDAIVLDLRLPDIDGFEVCRRVREAGRWAPILMLTARDSVDDRVNGLDTGADDYPTKPFVCPELFARVRALVRRGAVERPSSWSWAISSSTAARRARGLPLRRPALPATGAADAGAVVCSAYPAGRIRDLVSSDGALTVGRHRADQLSGGTGADELRGGDGTDALAGGSGGDQEWGGPGDDDIQGGGGSDTISGGSGADTIGGGPGDDTCTGSGGDDRITGGDGTDTISGGPGDDQDTQ